MRALLAILAASLLTAAPTHAQSVGAIEVLVRDAATGRGLEGAVVVVVDGPIGRTDASGHTILLDVPPGTHRVQIALAGYERDEHELEVVAAATTQLAVGLEQRVVEVEGVEVRGEARVARLERSGFYYRQKLYSGTFIMPEEIEAARTRGTPMSNVLRGRRGITLLPNPNGRGYSVVSTRNTVMASRPCFVPIYIDGVRRPGETDIDRVLPMMDVEAVEVYTGRSDTPLMYTSPCGAIVIWTRGQK